LNVVKNTLLRKAMEASEKDFEGLYGVLKRNINGCVHLRHSWPA